MEVEIIKAKGAGEDTSTGRKIDRLREGKISGRI